MPTFGYKRLRPLAALGAAALLAFVAFLGGCQDDGGPTGSQGPLAPPLEAKSDGTDLGGNQGFFFLPPVVANPSGHENFDAGGFNPYLEPWVEICELVDVGSGLPTTETDCASVAGWPHTFAFGATDGVRLVPDEDHYQVEWHTDAFNLNTDRYYRIFVYVKRILPTGPEDAELGFVDVRPLTAREMKSAKTGEVFALKDGRTLPIKFRIEADWVCGGSAEGCFAEVIDAATGGTVVNDSGDLVYVPPQDGGVFHVLGPDGSPTTAEQITVSMRYCAAPGLLPIDLPQYGDCLDNQAQPLLDPNPEFGLSPMAVVAMCSVDGTDPFGLGDQAPLVTMHRWDNNLEDGEVYALPHADWECAPVIGLAEPGGLFGLASRGWNTVRDGLAKLIAPRPLFANAPLMMHRGPAGPTEFFSWFRMALPATMEILEGDGQAAEVGSAVPIPPKVKVTDLHGGLVNGATITFTPSGAGAADPVTVVTGAAGEDGIAQTTWTLGDPGLNLLTASGRGIADPVNNGPREGADPFQPLDHDFDGTDGPAVTLQTGEVVFSAGGTQVGALCTENDPRCTQQVVVAGDPDTLVIESSGDLVFIPEQEGGFVVEDGQGGTTVVRAITVVAELCQLPDTALPIDLPQFGNCLDIRSEPQLSMDPQNPGLSDPAIVAMCSIEDPTFGLPANQWEYLTMHRYDEGYPVVALPHASWECPPDPIPVGAHGGWLGLASRGWNSLAKQFAPRPLFADARPVMHRGPAGPSEFFSKFRMALPAKMELLEGDGQIAPPGGAVSVAPAVMVTDLGDNPVSDARVTFTPSADASVDPVTVLTGSDGIARVTEFRVGTSVGDYTLTASGRGIADPVNNGPREGPDPFMPLDATWDEEEGSAVPLQTGEVVFTASAFAFVEQPSYTGDCINRPAGSVCLEFDDGYLWLVYDAVAGWAEHGTWHGQPIQSAIGFQAEYYHVLGTNLVYPGDGVLNGHFEAGTLSPWTIGGTQNYAVTLEDLGDGNHVASVTVGDGPTDERACPAPPDYPYGQSGFNNFGYLEQNFAVPKDRLVELDFRVPLPAEIDATETLECAGFDRIEIDFLVVETVPSFVQKAAGVLLIDYSATGGTVAGGLVLHDFVNGTQQTVPFDPTGTSPVSLGPVTVQQSSTIAGWLHFSMAVSTEFFNWLPDNVELRVTVRNEDNRYTGQQFKVSVDNVSAIRSAP